MRFVLLCWGVWANVSFKHRFGILSTESGHNILQTPLGAMVSSDRGKRGRGSDTCGTQIDVGNAEGCCPCSECQQKCSCGDKPAGAAHNAIFNKEGLHLSWLEQFASKLPPLLSAHRIPTRIHCSAGFTLCGSGSWGAPGVASVRRGHWKRFWGLFAPPPSLHLAICAKLRPRNSLSKTWILCLVFCVLCAISLGKNDIRHWDIRAWSWPSQLCHKAWEYPQENFWHDFYMLRKQFRGTGRLPVFLCEHGNLNIATHMAAVKRVWMRNSGGESQQKLVFSTSQNQSPEFLFSTSQINFPNLYFLHPKSVSMHFSLFPAKEIDDSVAGFEMKLTPTPQMLLKPMALAQGLCYCWHKVQSVTSVLLTELNIYTTMSSDSPNPRKWRFPMITLFSIEQRREEKSCYRLSFLCSNKGNVLYFVFIWVVLKDFKCLWCKNTPQTLVFNVSGDFYLGIPTQESCPTPFHA